MFVSVIIPVYNAGRILRECLQSVLDQDYPKDRYEIIVVDNKSTDTSVAIAQLFKEVKVYHQVELQGCSPTRNSGARHAKGDVLAFFDADQIMDKDYLKFLLEEINNDDYGAIASNCIPARSTETLVADYMSREVDTRKGIQYVDFFGGGSFAIKKAFFDSLGGFDEALLTTEDLDLALKVLDTGKLIKYEPRSFCFHKERPSLEALIKREFYFGVGSYIWGVRNKSKRIDPLTRIAQSLNRTLVAVIVIIKKFALLLLKKEKFREIQITALDVIMHWAKTAGILNGKKHFRNIQNGTFTLK